MFRQLGDRRIELTQGDITAQQVDAVVNAANSALAGGGGVDGAIHRAAGKSVMEETDRRYPDGCATGDAVATRGGRLPAKYIFHAVGPVWQGGQNGEEAALRSAIEKCLSLAEVYGCESIAFPAISTGVYGYPLDLAASAILSTLVAKLPESPCLKLARVVLFGEAAYGQFSRILESLLPNSAAGR